MRWPAPAIPSSARFSSPIWIALQYYSGHLPLLYGNLYFGRKQAGGIVGGGPGVYAWLGRSSLGVQLNISGRTKGRDEAYGFKLSHSGMTEWYLGPLISFTWENRLSSEIGGPR